MSAIQDIREAILVHLEDKHFHGAIPGDWAWLHEAGYEEVLDFHSEDHREYADGSFRTLADLGTKHTEHPVIREVMRDAFARHAT